MLFKLIFLVAIALVKAISAKEFYDWSQLSDMLEEKEAIASITTAFETDHQFTISWLQILIAKNFFEPVKYLINNVYNENNENDIVPVLRRFITKVREDQDKVLELANEKRKLNIFAPAFEWAQSMDSLALSIKFAHRLDSPSCIDIYNQNVTITETNLTVSCMCKRYDGIHKYILNHELFESINTTASFYEFQSGGRLYVNLTKLEKPKRWRRLLKSEERPQNMRIWWELQESFGDLESHTVFETDDEFEDLVKIDNRPKKTGKKRKLKKKTDSDSTQKEDL